MLPPDGSGTDLACEAHAVEVGGVAHQVAVLELEQVESADLDVLPGRLYTHERRSVQRALETPFDRAALLAGDEAGDGGPRVGHRREHRLKVVAKLLASAEEADGHDVLDALVAPMGRHAIRVAVVHRLEVRPELLLHRPA